MTLGKASRQKRPEQDFQIKLVRDLRAILAPDVFLTAFPAGGGGAKRGAFLKAMGLVPGVPDLLLIYEGHVHFMELKAKGCILSKTQRECAMFLGRCGAKVQLARSLEDALEILAEWNIPTRIKDGATSLECRPAKIKDTGQHTTLTKRSGHISPLPGRA